MDCTVKGNLPSEIFEDIKKIADNRINFQQLKNKTVFVSDCHGLIAYYIICTLLEGNDFFENNTRVITLAKAVKMPKSSSAALLSAKILLLKSEIQRTFRRLKEPTL